MIRVHVICEGQTEEMFVSEVLSKVFIPQGIHLYPSLIGKPGHKGGNFRFERLLTDVRIRLLNDSATYCTTLFDFYGLPGDFPGKEEAKKYISHSEKADCLTRNLIEQLKARLGEKPLLRFIPYVQMYEFEGLLFSDPDRLAQGICQTKLAKDFDAIRQNFNSPEEINDSPTHAPSKRIAALFQEYDKPIHGPLAAIEIGFDVIRRECPLFDGWIQRIESLAISGNQR